MKERCYILSHTSIWHGHPFLITLQISAGILGLGSQHQSVFRRSVSISVPGSPRNAMKPKLPILNRGKHVGTLGGISPSDAFSPTCECLQDRA